MRMIRAVGMRRAVTRLGVSAVVIAIERQVEAPVGDRKNHKRGGDAAWNSGNMDLQRRQKTSSSALVTGNGDKDRHDQAVPDEVDPAEGLDRGGKDDKQDDGRQSPHEGCP